MADPSDDPPSLPLGESAAGFLLLLLPLLPLASWWDFSEPTLDLRSSLLSSVSTASFIVPFLPSVIVVADVFDLALGSTTSMILRLYIAGESRFLALAI